MVVLFVLLGSPTVLLAYIPACVIFHHETGMFKGPIANLSNFLYLIICKRNLDTKKTCGSIGAMSEHWPIEQGLYKLMHSSPTLQSTLPDQEQVQLEVLWVCPPNNINTTTCYKYIKCSGIKYLG